MILLQTILYNMTIATTPQPEHIHSTTGYTPALVSRDPKHDAALQHLANTFAVTCILSHQAQQFFKTKPLWWLQWCNLADDSNTLALSLHHASQWKKPLQIDFVTPSIEQHTSAANTKTPENTSVKNIVKNTINPHLTQGRNSPLARAVGLKIVRNNYHILDACAGLGRDALVFARLGSQVTLVERNPYIALLLHDALHRLKQHNPALAQRMQLVHADAYHYLQSNTIGAFSAIYLDPMFPATQQRSAQVKRSMQIMRAFLSHATTTTRSEMPENITAPQQTPQSLACLAQQHARRVVMKRAKRGAKLLTSDADHIFKAGSVSYDVYINPQIPCTAK